MKLSRLTISEFRGIRSLDIPLNTKTTAILGSNGTGKSGIIDAINFLLTGEIERICGDGTQGITLPKHGKHISCDNDDNSYVEGEFKDSNGQLIKVKRDIKSPKTIQISPDNEHTRSALSDASKANYILTRRHILKYIHTTPKNRQSSVSNILNLQNIDTIRDTLTKAKNDTRKTLNSKNGTLAIHSERWRSEFINLELDPNNYQTIINEIRKEFNAPPLEDTNSHDFTDGISGPNTDPHNTGLTRKRVHDSIESLSKLTAKNEVQQIIELESKTRALISELTNTNGPLFGREKLALIENATTIISEEKGKCPLCDTEWDHDDLTAHIQKKKEELNHVASTIQDIKLTSSKIIQKTTKILAELTTLKDCAIKLEDQDTASFFEKWIDDVKAIATWHNDATAKHPHPYARDDIGEALSPNVYPEKIAQLQTATDKKLPDLTTIQEKWNLLIRLKEIANTCDISRAERAKASTIAQRAESLLNAYTNARMNILDTTYSNIANRFEHLYKSIHDDEKTFVANIEATSAGLDFQVDFHGKGIHPPNALHSEGHQDSMGICLYLALAEHSPINSLNIMALDDVVTSIDASHRNDICKILKDEFEDTQFIITTHDKVWYNQLRRKLNINKDNSIEFYNWNVDTGPLLRITHDFIEVARKKALDNDLNSAAHELRIGLEAFFLEKCTGLRAKAPIRPAADWPLSELSDSANSTLKDKLQKAAKHAINDDAKTIVTDLLTNLKNAANDRIVVEWGVNPLVHHNEWANFSKEDFLPIVDAFDALIRCFSCANCQSAFIYDTFTKELRCGCRCYPTE